MSNFDTVLHKSTLENFIFGHTFRDLLGAGETIVLGSSSVIAKEWFTGVASTTLLFGAVPQLSLNAAGDALNVRIIAGQPAGHHLAIFTVFTTNGQKLEGRRHVSISPKRPVMWVDRTKDEEFPVGNDFASELATGEVVTGGVVGASDYFTNADTTAALILGGAQVIGSKVAATLRGYPGAPPAGLLSQHEVALRASTNQGNVYEETIIVRVS